MSDPYCIVPWYHQQVQTDGRIQPCCHWTTGEFDTDRDSYLHGPIAEELRNQFLRNNIPRGCSACVYMEKTSGWSFRKHAWNITKSRGIDWRDGPRLRSEELNLSNICNLRCRMCNSTRSSKWIADEIAEGKEPSRIKQHNWSLSEENVNDFVELIFLGGEPMLHQEQILRELVKMHKAGTLGQLQLNFTTNVMVALHPEMLDILRECRSLHIECSIDAHGKLNEYIRSDSDWPTIASNFKQIVKAKDQSSNLSTSISMCYGALNAHATEDLIRWADDQYNGIKFNLIPLFSPKIYDARNLPPTIKVHLIDRYQRLVTNLPGYKYLLDGIIDHLGHGAPMMQRNWIKQLRAHTEFLDARRNVRLMDINPELGTLLGMQ